MNTAFQNLALADVRPGMVLSDVLLDRQGQVLLPEGAILTEAIIALLPRHGIERLAVLRTEQAGPVAASVDEAAVTARLARLFRHCDRTRDEDSATATLHDYVLDYRLDREIAA
ncbi:hypothetical protein [Massilia sp. DWR3-1-1]|uniref:hypothetical protein n=1 Tax=Massilia sp. DWR3-1-1 TaxID=2804559 RepID=UPI003CEB9FD4